MLVVKINVILMGILTMAPIKKKAWLVYIVGTCEDSSELQVAVGRKQS